MMVKRYTDFVTGYARAIVFFVVLATAILGYYAQYLGSMLRLKHSCLKMMQI